MATAVYRIAPNARRILLLTCAGIAAFPIFLGAYAIIAADGAARGAALIIALIMSPFIAYLSWCVRRPRLELDPEGLTLVGVLGRKPVRVGWADVEAIHLGPGHAGLVLSAPEGSRAATSLSEFAGVRINGVPMYTPEVARWIAERRWVPFDAFAGWLDAGNLRADLERLAPALVARMDAERPAVIAARRTGMRALYAVLGATALLCVVIVCWTLFGPEVPPAMQTRLSAGMQWFERIASILIALVLALSGAANLQAAWQRLRTRRYGHALLWLLAGVIQILLAITVAGTFW